MSGKQGLVSGKCPLQLSASVRVQGFNVRKLSAHVAEVWNVRLVDFKPPVIKFLFAFEFLFRKTNKTDTQMALEGLKPVFFSKSRVFGL